MKTTTVRIDAKTHEKLRCLAKETGQPMSDVLALAVKTLEEKRFWDAVEAHYAALQADPAAWASYQREMREIEEAFGMDGLEDEEPYPLDPDQRRRVARILRERARARAGRDATVRDRLD